MKYLGQIKKGGIVLTLIFFIVTTFISCSRTNESSDKVKIGYLAITHALPLFEESLENKSVELIKFGSWSELMEALNSGKIQGASVLIELAIKSKMQGINLKAVALGHRDGNAVVVSENINSVKDLKGKNFAIPNKLSTHNILFYEMLKKENMSIKDINLTELPPSEMAVALFEGRIDGYCVAEPFGAKAVVNGNGKVLKESSDIINNSICCALVFREEFINNQKETAKTLAEDYIKAAKYLEENKDKSKEKAKEFLKVQREVLETSLDLIKFDDLKIKKEDYEVIGDYLKEMGLMDNVPSYEDFVDNSLIDWGLK